jgi:hypothetical protein
LLLMLLVRLVVTWLRGNECGWRRPLKKIWSAGDVVEEGESGVRDPNSKSESSWFGVLGNEKESPLGLLFEGEWLERVVSVLNFMELLNIWSSKWHILELENVFKLSVGLKLIGAN